MSFRLKIILGIALIQITLAVILTLSGLSWVKSAFEGEMEGHAKHTAQLLATTTKDHVIGEDLAALQSFVNEALGDHEIAYVRIMAYDQVLAALGYGDALAKPFKADEDITQVDDGVFDTRADIEESGTHFGWVELGISTADLNATLADIRNKAFAIGAVLVAASLLLAAFLGTLLSRRVQSLQHAATRISEGEIGHHITAHGHDEIAETAQAFNRMSSRLAKMYQGQQDALNQANELAEELRDSETYTRAIIDHINDVIVTTDAQGIVVTANPAIEKIFGFTREELVGQNIATLMPRDLAATHGGYLRAYSSSRSELPPIMGRDRLLHGQRKDGRRIPIEITVSPIETDGELGFVGILRDVTERMAMERALIDAKEAAELGAKAKATFLANMSHEIRTPMNGVLGMMELLSKTELDERQRSHLQTARNSASLLLGIINDILDFSKIDAGKLSLENIEFDLRGCIDDVGQLLSARAAEKGLELHTQIDNALPFRVKGDPTRFAQILNNLVGNAIKFTEQGEVNVHVTLDQHWDDKLLLRVQIKDTGIGIPEETQAQLFSPFSQADDATTRHFGGTGLGLSISKQLASLMNGDIGVRSQPGQGSTFWFTCQMEAGSARLAPRLDNCRDKRVLIVDDNDTNREVLEHYLEGWDVTYLSAADADEARQRLADADPPLNAILMDMQMPGMDGLTLARQLSAEPQYRELPVVMLSSDGNTYSHDDSPNIIGSLNKPIPYKLLHDLLSNSLCEGIADRPGQPAATATTEQSAADPAAENQGAHVLLVDDNLVNLEVAKGMLEHFGLRVSTAGDGQQALDLYRQDNDFDLVLMDCQMPVLDGYAATRAIRELEAGTDRHLPIVALTANALEGHREKSLESGMDDHLTKPFDAADLEHILANWLGNKMEQSTAQDAPEPEPSPVASAKVAFDSDKADDLIARMGKNFERILEHFRDNSAELLQEMREAESPEAVYRAAHTLKGSSATLGASGLADYAKALETQAHEGDLSGLEEHLTRIAAAVDQAVQLLEVRLAALDD